MQQVPSSEGHSGKGPSARVSEPASAFPYVHSSEQLQKMAPSASAESVHAAAEIAAIMQCPPAVDPTLENQPTPKAVERTQLPNAKTLTANGHGQQQQQQGLLHGDNNHQYQLHSRVIIYAEPRHIYVLKEIGFNF